jgi:hypothetical protein
MILKHVRRIAIRQVFLGVGLLLVAVCVGFLACAVQARSISPDTRGLPGPVMVMLLVAGTLAVGGAGISGPAFFTLARPMRHPGLRRVRDQGEDALTELESGFTQAGALHLGSSGFAPVWEGVWIAVSEGWLVWLTWDDVGAVRLEEITALVIYNSFFADPHGGFHSACIVELKAGNAVERIVLVAELSEQVALALAERLSWASFAVLPDRFFP